MLLLLIKTEVLVLSTACFTSISNEKACNVHWVLIFFVFISIIFSDDNQTKTFLELTISSKILQANFY